MSPALEALCRRFGGHKPELMNAKRKFAVLCPLLEQSDGPHLLFEVRAAGLRQGGEVCFPGGRMEPGETPADCALRETKEELGISRDHITLLGTPDFMCTHRGFFLQPILGLVSLDGLNALTPSPAEVAEVFTAPLSFFRTTPPEIYTYDLVAQVREPFPYAAVGISPDYPWDHGKVEVPVWYWQGRAVWGMTARIIQHLIAE